MPVWLHGWRGKWGCITLVMALAVTGLWIRSRVVWDAVSFPLLDRQHAIHSVNGLVFWSATDIRPGSGQWGFGSTHEDLHMITYGLIHLEKEFSGARELHFRSWVIPLWTVAWPLLLLSAWLILGTRRPRIQRGLLN